LLIACLGTRNDPYEIFDLPPRSILVLRTVGGHLTSVLAEIAALHAFFDVHQIVLLHHMDCGASYQTMAGSLADIKAKWPEISNEELQDLGMKLLFARMIERT
jgi:carbonic anhydrase